MATTGEGTKGAVAVAVEAPPLPHCRPTLPNVTSVTNKPPASYLIASPFLARKGVKGGAGMKGGGGVEGGYGYCSACHQTCTHATTPHKHTHNISVYDPQS